ncbi:hypothetical protein [Clostridium perfringens]|uniref:hypothetical protein n=1 Tax=Clostridium perfringens TaxID=1502 RepID=UPI0024BCFDC3|nr:hypothetical protein [Clostridium perfringens]
MNSNDIKKETELRVLEARELIEEEKTNGVEMDKFIEVQTQLFELSTMLINIGAAAKQINEIMNLIEEINGIMISKI